MTRPGRRVVRGLSLFAALFGAALLLAPPDAARAQKASKVPFGEGTHALRAILNKLDLKPITSQAEFAQLVRDGQSHEVLLISLGKMGQLNFIHNQVPAPPSLRREHRENYQLFVEKGGAILVATDQPSGQIFGASVAGNFVRVSEDSAAAYRKSEFCPFVEAVPNRNVPIFEGLNQGKSRLTRVATNRPSFLQFNDPCPLDRLALFPYAETDIEGALADADHPLLYFAAGGEVGAGRVLVLADHSLFINDMLLQEDNDNFFLAMNSIDWLTDRGKNQPRRTRVLFVEDGEIVTNFNVRLKEPPIPPLPTEAELVKLTNRMLVDLERENYFNRKLLAGMAPTAPYPNQPPDPRLGHARVLQWLTVLLSLALVFFGLARLTRARHRIDPRVVPTEMLAWPSPSDPIISRRQQAMLKQDNFWEAAREQARQFFAAALGSRPVAAAPMPPVTSEGGWLYRHRISRQVRDLWRLATGAPRRVPFVEFRRLSTQTAALSTALANSTLHIGDRTARPGGTA